MTRSTSAGATPAAASATGNRAPTGTPGRAEVGDEPFPASDGGEGGEGVERGARLLATDRLLRVDGNQVQGCPQVELRGLRHLREAVFREQHGGALPALGYQVSIRTPTLDGARPTAWQICTTEDPWAISSLAWSNSSDSSTAILGYIVCVSEGSCTLTTRLVMAD